MRPLLCALAGLALLRAGQPAWCFRRACGSHTAASCHTGQCSSTRGHRPGAHQAQAGARPEKAAQHPGSSHFRSLMGCWDPPPSSFLCPAHCYTPTSGQQSSERLFLCCSPSSPAEPLSASQGDPAWSAGCDRLVAVQSRLEVMEETVEKTAEHLEAQVKSLLELLEELSWNLPAVPFSPAPDLLADDARAGSPLPDHF
ncbi:PREDICTED: placenta-specific protein 9 isoform X2 [Chinchilla lanigera]|uniref:placenta-specific protein 9 isoform X2 n=1 Tax=Chinchilla lanigera TaxID=34839 RepID=UPI0006983823|nr:PREDICTED: placenta-specific protein 9 isoform X2 [Chinchilla lanigera]